MSHVFPLFSSAGAFLALALATGGLRGMETTGSAAVSAGSMDSDSGLNFDGAYAVMLGGGFGVQVDGMHSSIGKTEFTGGGAQVFWQNDGPWLASLGIASVHGEWLDSQEISTGLEFQQPRYSVGAKFGYAQIGYDNRVPFIDDEDNSLLMEIRADFYASDTLRASLGIEHRFDLLFARVELEWLTPVDGLSVFANCMAGENNYDHALIGLRYYFGGERKSLKSRRQTPRPMGSGVLHGIGNHGAFYNTRAKRYYVANQSWGFSNGSVNYGRVTNSSATYGNSWTVVGGSGVVGGGTLIVGGGSSNFGPGSNGTDILTLGNYVTFTVNPSPPATGSGAELPVSPTLTTLSLQSYFLNFSPIDFQMQPAFSLTLTE